jgi:flagellar biosynthetic protein FliR
VPVSFDAILPHVTPFVLVLSRVGGLFLFAPLLSSPAIPRQVRIVMVIALTLTVYPTVDHAPALELRPDLLGLAPIVATETLIGMSIGLFANLPLMFVQLGGLLMGQQMGLGIAQIINPATNIQGDNLGQTLFLMTLALFTLLGGVELLWGALVHTFAIVPLAAFRLELAPLDVVVGLTQAGFEMAVRVAMPVLVIIFLENIALGFIMKTVPALNILSFGFPIRILIGLIVFVAALDFMRVTIDEELDRAVQATQDWVLSLAAPPTPEARP